MKKLLIYGGNGLVGSRLIELLTHSFLIFAPTRFQTDITNKANLKKDIEELDPDIIINSAGLTSFRESESEPKKARSLNFMPSKLITELIGTRPISYCYISTDAVFTDMNKVLPHRESDTTNPLTIYGKTKLLGEKITLSSNKKNCVIRLIRPYSNNFANKTDMVRMCLNKFQRGEIVEGVTDQTINPLFVDDVAKAIEKILSSNNFGIYHVAASDGMSSYDFIKLIAMTFNYDQKLVKKINLSSFKDNSKLTLSNNCMLDVTRFGKEFGKLPTMAQSLLNFKKKLDSEKGF